MRPIIALTMLAAVIGARLHSGTVGSESASAAAPQPATPKRITIAIQTELKGFVRDYRGDGRHRRGEQPTTHRPQLAGSRQWNGCLCPSAGHGAALRRQGHLDPAPGWRGIGDDLEIQPNVKWHDGTPLTADDLVFSGTVCRDAEIPCLSRSNIRAVSSLEARDPQTLVVQWSGPYANAAQAEGLAPIPRHLLEELYQTDKPNFPLSTRFTSEFVGLGPYRLEHWELGSHIEFRRFDDYPGASPLDQVFVRFLGDANTMVAAILAGSVDVLLPLGVSLEEAIDLKQRWQGYGNQVLFGPSNTLYSLYFQLGLTWPGQSTASPTLWCVGGCTTPSNRAQISEAGLAGVAPVADSWVPSTDPLRPDLESHPAVPLRRRPGPAAALRSGVGARRGRRPGQSGQWRTIRD